MKLGTVVMINEKYPTPFRRGEIGVVTGDYTPTFGKPAWQCFDGSVGTILFEDEMDILHVPVEPGDVAVVTENYAPHDLPRGLVVLVLDRSVDFWRCSAGNGRSCNGRSCNGRSYHFYENELEVIG